MGQMSASTAQNEGRDPDVKDAVEHLERALEILDSSRVSADVGARLQEVIDQLKTTSAG
jgi:hypothetical protein